MTRRSWIVAALGVVLLVAAAFGILWLGWDWKALIGWKALVDYINPKNATGRKDAVQVYALVVAGGVATITAAVGLLNLRLTGRNLEQQRELEAQRAQGTALQAYYEQIGKLITEFDLRNTQREEIRELARGQTLTVLQEVDRAGKESLLTFLYKAGLIPAVALDGADLRGVVLRNAELDRAILRGADLFGADLRRSSLYKADLEEANLERVNLLEANFNEADLHSANLRRANLFGANFHLANLQRANLHLANLRRANLSGANLERANLRETAVTEKQLADTLSLQGATMADGSVHP